MEVKKNIECPICGENMERYYFDYNTNEEERIDYKCPNCGHKKTILVQS